MTLQADSLTEEQVSEFKEAFSLFVSHLSSTQVHGQLIPKLRVLMSVAHNRTKMATVSYTSLVSLAHPYSNISIRWASAHVGLGGC